jgi:hypothetical protein
MIRSLPGHLFPAADPNPNGLPDIKHAELLINATSNFASGYYEGYDRANNSLSPRNDDGAAWLGAGPPGTNVTLTSNSQYR